MQLFYVPIIDESKVVVFDTFLARHIVTVLRKREGDLLYLTNGGGDCFQVKLIVASKKIAKADIIKKNSYPKKHRYYLHLAIAPTKSSDRMSWMVEKLTEIGVDRITFLTCMRSERKSINVEKMKKTAIAAMQQSLRFYLPKIDQLVSLKVFVNDVNVQQKIITSCNTNINQRLRTLVDVRHPVRVLVGPEGDFTSDEIQYAKDHGYNNVSLGDVRYRGETAALVIAQNLGFLAN